MHRPGVTSSSASLAAFRRGEPGVPVGVTLLGVPVTAHVIRNVAEHRRREAAGMGAVINPALLDRLMDLPAGIPVTDPVVWPEMADQPPGILERSEDAARVTRRLASPLTISDVVVDAAAGQELRAVQDASLFAGFTRRWVAAGQARLPDAVMLEAKLCGAGILDQRGGVVLAAEKPVALVVDGWSWLLEEKTYRRWLTRRTENHGQGSPAPATDGASARAAG